MSIIARDNVGKRRGRGEGSLTRVKRKRSDGTVRESWCARLTIGRGRNGQLRRRAVYGATKSDVLAQLNRLRVNVFNGISIGNERQSVDAYLRRWLEDSVRPSVRPATYRMYEGLVRLHLTPRLGRHQLSRLTSEHIQDALADMERAGQSPRLRQLARGTMFKALKKAVKWGIVGRNACENVEKPKAPAHAIHPLDTAQVRILLKASATDRLHALYVVAIATGMRQGELLALDWEDVDLRARQLSVRFTLTRGADGKLERTEPKSPAGRRRIDLPNTAVAALKKHRARMLAEGHPRGLVFSDRLGGPLTKEHMVRQSFRRILAAAKLPMIRFHDLRHTAATLMLGQNVHPKIVQERLGHSDIRMTLDTYSHVTPTMQREAANRLDELLRPAVSK